MRVQASSHWEQSSQLILRIVIYIHLNSCLLSHANNLSDICISSQHCPLLSKPQLTIFLSVLEHSKLVSSTEKALPLLPSACVSLQDLFLFSQRISWNKQSGWDRDTPCWSFSYYILFVFHSTDNWNYFLDFKNILNYFLILGYKFHEKKDLVCLVHCSKAISSNETWPRVKKVFE